ncbi:MAG: ABC transporter permease [Ectothiorhodospiraceae bacterium]|nr:ABC transporter permease [Chromatiales bacterium]MCP5154125.1 ABC transporter permease [Ectothiorhodospiraceae bacterium]
MVAAIVVFMLVPLAVVVASSLSASEFLVFPPRGLSLRWYQEILSSREYTAAAWTSLKLACVVTVVSLAIGTAAAIALARSRFPGRELLVGLFLSPLVLPTIIFGIGLLMVFSRYADGPSFAALAVGHVVVTLPYVVRTVSAVLEGADRHAEEAARTMGARWWQRYWHVVIPQCRGGMLAGAFFAFNISFDEAVIALFLRVPGAETLPLTIYSKLEFSPDPSVAAVSSVLIALTVLLIVIAERLLGLDTLTR